MEKQSGDSYIRETASFIRTNERSLAESGLIRRRRGNGRSNSASPSSLLPLGWLSPGSSSAPPKPILLSTDTHHLFYVLMRLEALGFDIGSLDVHVQSPSRPTSYANIYPEQRDTDTLSLASFRSSLSMVSRISLGGSWWSPEPPSIDVELKYIYSSFTKLPAISISAPGKKAITELIDQSPDRNAIPLDVFKNLERLECDNIDPRTLLGWNRLADSLKSFKIKKSGLEDLTEIFIQAVLDDQARRQRTSSRPLQSIRNSEPLASFKPSSLPSAVNENDIPADGELATERADVAIPSMRLSPSKWASLRHLYLPDNGLTFFPAELLPYLTSLTHLDLSSNLFVSVPPGFGELYNLLSLNLADNLIDSVLGIYMNLGQILSLNLSRNRLESLCGLERLLALERIDLRHNLLEESSEISRLAVLPNISELWIDGNPLVEIEEASYRVTCFDYFWKEGKVISLDGSQPTMYEQRSLTPSERVVSTPAPPSSSTPIIAIEPSRNQLATPSLHPHRLEELSSTGFSSIAPGSGSTNVGGRRSRKPKRIVDLNENQFDDTSSSHSRVGSGRLRSTLMIPPKKVEESPGSLPPKANDANTPISNPKPTLSPFISAANSAVDTAIRSAVSPSEHSRHSRYQTEYTSVPPTLSTSSDFLSPDQPKFPLFSNSNTHGRSNTLSRAEARRTRISASAFEPAPPDAEAMEQADVDAYRKTIESLKKDMGDSWLKVFSQSQSS